MESSDRYTSSWSLAGSKLAVPGVEKTGMSQQHCLWAAHVHLKPASPPSLSLRPVGLKRPPGWSASPSFLSFRPESVIWPLVPSQKLTVTSARLSAIPYASQQQSPANCVSSKAPIFHLPAHRACLQSSHVNFLALVSASILSPHTDPSQLKPRVCRTKPFSCLSQHGD